MLEIFLHNPPIKVQGEWEATKPQSFSRDFSINISIFMGPDFSAEIVNPNQTLLPRFFVLAWCNLGLKSPVPSHFRLHLHCGITPQTAQTFDKREACMTRKPDEHQPCSYIPHPNPQTLKLHGWLFRVPPAKPLLQLTQSVD